MRDETRARLRALLWSTSAKESGVAGVAEGIPPPNHPLSHRLPHLAGSPEILVAQGVTPATPVTRGRMQADEDRHTSSWVAQGCAGGVAPTVFCEGTAGRFC